MGSGSVASIGARSRMTLGARSTIVTIDGPAGTGKSTVAHHLAARLGLEFLDTGAMYRAAALLAIESGIAPEDGPALATVIERTGMRFDWTLDPPALLLGGRDVSDRIRDADVAAVVSQVAAQPAVRRVLVGWQRRIGAEHPRLVTEGRDQGSVVFPEAPLRLYLDADEDVRAARRARQLEAKGRAVDEEAIRREIRRRDSIDSSRRDAPLTCPEGAIVLDTTALTLDEVVDRLEEIARESLPEAPFAPRTDGP